MFSTPILNTSAFPPMPAFPTIRKNKAYNISVSNKIYFNRKTLIKAYKFHEESTQKDQIEEFWEIPFSYDIKIPEVESRERIDIVMASRKIYKFWITDYDRSIITAVRVANDADFTGNLPYGEVPIHMQDTR